MKSFSHFCFFILFLHCLRSLALDCRNCKMTIGADSCNATACVIDCHLAPKPQCNTGLCLTTLKFDDVKGHTVSAMTFCQKSNKSLNIFTSEQINGHCDYYDGSLHCECGFDDCNHVISFPPRFTTVANDITVAEIEQPSTIMIVIGSLLGFVFLIGAVIALYFLIQRCVRLHDEDYECKLTPGSRLSSDDASMDEAWDETGKHSYSAFRYSSSVATQYTRGSRANALNHNEQHLPIKLEKIIGRGRYAEVWKGALQQQEPSTKRVVSVKVFQLRNYGAWRQEKDMLTENWMRHENIIEFYSSEQRTVRSRLQYWLVTAYYEQGSLAEFLRSNILEWSQFCSLVMSIANGLSYLHEERDSSGRAKIPIAHRDVKSCNILVKDDCSSCVLADFGLSLKLDPELTRDELSNAGQVGTSRYMAPELLERLVNLSDIEMFKRVDVYAMALVMWEMANRCEAVEGMASPYRPPFGDQINDHPTKQQMLLLVCKERQLPEIPVKWQTHVGLSRFVDEILSESWEYDAEARITARCVYERLSALRNSLVISELEESDDKLREKTRNEANKPPTDIISTVV